MFTATEARNHFFELVKSATLQHQIHHIHHHDGTVVLLSEEDYENLIETIELLSTAGFRKSIERSKKQIKLGETYSFEQVFGRQK